MGVRKLPAILLAILSFAVLPVQPRADDTDAQAETAYVHAGLGAVERWEKEVYGDTSRLEQIDLNVKLSSLLEELTRLYEVAKMPPALPRIKKLLAKYDVPERYGFAAGGMLAAGIQRMELKNEAYAGYTMFLVRIENRTGQPLDGGPAEAVLYFPDGSVLGAETVDAGHELYPQVSRILARFQAPASIGPATEGSFIAAFMRPGLGLRGAAYVTIAYGDFRFVIKCYENLP